MGLNSEMTGLVSLLVTSQRGVSRVCKLATVMKDCVRADYLPKALSVPPNSSRWVEKWCGG
jgi:hypothetical protein